MVAALWDQLRNHFAGIYKDAKDTFRERFEHLGDQLQKG
jgi:hypothetical protein